ncbi:MAG TPA: hypothetical protein VGJ74_06095 [Burkholderiales bacterium]
MARLGAIKGPLATAAAALCLAASLYPPGVAHGEAQARVIAERLTLNFFPCAERVWPGVPWETLAFVFHEPHSGGATLIARKRGDDRWAIEPLAAERLGAIHPSALKASFALIELDGRRTLLTRIDARANEDEAQRATEVALHEAFHKIGQRHFRSADNVFRGPQLPANVEVRAMRRMLAERLLFEDAGAIPKAAYWHKRYVSSDPSRGQTTSALDRIEGSAEFVGILGTALAELGCTAPTHKIHERALQYVSAKWTARYDRLFDSFPDVESYVIGAAASLRLDMKNAPRWRDEVASGRTPAELLLEQIEPANDVEDAATVARLRKSYDSLNRRYAQRLSDLASRAAASPAPRIGIGSGGHSGAYQPTQGFFLVQVGERVKQAALGVNGSFSFDDGALSAELLRADVLLNESTPCSAQPRWVLLPDKDVAVAAFFEGTVLARTFQLKSSRGWRVVGSPPDLWICIP